MFRNASRNVVVPQYPKAYVLCIFFFSSDLFLFYKNTGLFFFFDRLERKKLFLSLDSLRSPFLRGTSSVSCELHLQYEHTLYYNSTPTKTLS